MAIETPRILVGAVQGRSGKTTLTIGLLRALKNRGLKVQPYKKGPDYIDPSWLSAASGMVCGNLDAVMMSNAQILHSLVSNSQGADISLIEGAMGIFDGLDVDGSNSSAELAYLTKTPVLLVVSGQRITRSVAALVNGVVQFDPRIHIGGLILNQVARPRHENIMRAAIEKYCDIPILGALPKTTDIAIPDRHLGLIPAGEQAALHDRIDRLGSLVARHTDLDKIIAMAKTAAPLEDPLPEKKPISVEDPPKIGVFRDRAFSFYYPENIEALEKEGAEVRMINALTDHHLPAIDGLYIGGGFPEILAPELSANITLRQEVKEAIENGLPVYAECGGLMYLVRNLLLDDDAYPMVGVFPADIVMEKKPQGHGYSIQKATEKNPYFSTGSKIFGHEFHNSRLVIDDDQALDWGYVTIRGKGAQQGEEQRYDGLIYKNVMAAYHHFHALSDGQWAEKFVAKAQEYKRS